MHPPACFVLAPENLRVTDGTELDHLYLTEGGDLYGVYVFWVGENGPFWSYADEEAMLKGAKGEDT